MVVVVIELPALDVTELEVELVLELLLVSGKRESVVTALVNGAPADEVTELQLELEELLDLVPALEVPWLLLEDADPTVVEALLELEDEEGAVNSNVHAYVSLDDAPELVTDPADDEEEDPVGEPEAEAAVL